jgi:hypothetical protein
VVPPPTSTGTTTPRETTVPTIPRRTTTTMCYPISHTSLTYCR